MRLFFILLSIAYTCIYNVYIFSLLAILKQKSLQEEVRKYKKNVLIITNVMNSYTGLGYQPVY